jgi:uncharacterized protein YidB (DUF937 family)
MGLQETLAALFGSSTAGTAPTLSSAVSEMLAGQGSGQGAGGLSGLVERFRDAGFGDVVQSWIGTGDNAPIGADALHNVLGADRVNALADKTGLPVDQLLTQLSQHLPGIVDKLTPNGELPEGGMLQAMLAKFTQQA